MPFDLVARLQLIETKARELRELIATTELEHAKEQRSNTDLTVLSEHEMRVLDMVKEGKNSAQIALALRISKKTVETHRYNIRKKLRLSLAEFKDFVRT